jgi:hypothetical protein
MSPYITKFFTIAVLIIFRSAQVIDYLLLIGYDIFTLVIVTLA